MFEVLLLTKERLSVVKQEYTPSRSSHMSSKTIRSRTSRFDMSKSQSTSTMPMKLPSLVQQNHT